MNKPISIFLAIALLFAMCVTSVSAAESDVIENDRIRFDDGSYVVIELLDNIAHSSMEMKSKSYTYYSSDGVAQWVATLTGAYSYDGVTATCTSAVCSVTIYKDGWYELSKEVTSSAATATADLTMACKVFGITYIKRTIQMNLTCDKDGNFS